MAKSGWSQVAGHKWLAKSSRSKVEGQKLFGQNSVQFNANLMAIAKFYVYISLTNQNISTGNISIINKYQHISYKICETVKEDKCVADYKMCKLLDFCSVLYVSKQCPKIV